MEILADNGITKVWKDGPWVYKKQPKFMTDNEIWILEQLFPTGYVPWAAQVEIDTLQIAYITPDKVINRQEFLAHYGKVLEALESVTVRHGDLTEKNVLVSNNQPYLIDFSESRLTCDPRPDKRPEGDSFWLKKTMEVYAYGA